MRISSHVKVAVAAIERKAPSRVITEAGTAKSPRSPNKAKKSQNLALGSLVQVPETSFLGGEQEGLWVVFSYAGIGENIS